MKTSTTKRSIQRTLILTHGASAKPAAQLGQQFRLDKDVAG